MRCGLCGFLIIKLQTALHHAVWCGVVQDYLQCGAVMPFCGRFWYGFCSLCGLCGLVNTPSCDYYLVVQCLHNATKFDLLMFHNLAFFTFLCCWVSVACAPVFHELCHAQMMKCHFFLKSPVNRYLYRNCL